MLWYKAWLETRVRFLICLLAIPALCAYTVNFDIRRADYRTQMVFYYSVVHGNYGLIAALWLVAVIFLTVGGLLREQAVGAASFTLALPLARTRLVGIRIALGLTQAITLIVVPCIAICIEENMIGKPYPLSQVWFHIVLMVSGGLVYFAIAMLIASLLGGEYTAPLVSFCVVIGTAFVLADPPARTFNPFHFMGGGDYFDTRSGLLLGPIPWLHAGACVLAAALLLAASVKAIQIREF